MTTIIEPSKKIPVILDVDICVLGGSCTGVFAAVRAARLGATVAIVEKQNCFGGMATAGMVNIWHTLNDNRNENQVIAGLTKETLDRLDRRGGIVTHQKVLKENDPNAYMLNTEELKIELDELIKENNITPYLHTYFSRPIMDDKNTVRAIIVENKDGQNAIKAKVFVDATGDGDLLRRMGHESYTYDHIQPPSMCAKLYGIDTIKNLNWRELVAKHREEFNLYEDWGWNCEIPSMPKLSLHAETHVFDVNCGDASMLTYSEIEGRRQIRAYTDLLKKYGPEGTDIAIASLPSSIGIRDSYHIKCAHHLTENELLTGVPFDDAIAFGSYRVDIHHDEGAGITFRYLDGTEEVIDRSCAKERISKWGNVPVDYKPYYEIPYRCITPIKSKNVLAAGRMIDAEKGAFGAVRVMVTTNQLGEAAGTAAYIALNENKSIHQVNPNILRSVMKNNGSIIL